MQPIWIRALLALLAAVLLFFTLPAYLDTANNPGLATLSGEVASLGSVAGAFLARQLGIALIALYGAINGRFQPVLIGAFGVAFFNLHDAVFLSVMGSGGAGAVAGLVLGAVALLIMGVAWRGSRGEDKSSVA